MRTHITVVSRRPVAPAQDDNVDYVTIITFIIALLGALNDLFDRKAEPEPA